MLSRFLSSTLCAPQTLPVKSFKLNIAKKEVDFIETSFKPYGLSCMSNPAFLNNVIEFGKMGKDKINEETIEFLVPYLDIEGFNPQVGKTTGVVTCQTVRVACRIFLPLVDKG